MVRAILEEGQPACEEEVDLLDVVQLERWATAISKQDLRISALNRFNIGVYQYAQYRKTDYPQEKAECAGALMIHMLGALGMVNGGISHLGLKRIDTMLWSGAVDGRAILGNVAVATQMFFYEQFSPVGSIRRDRYKIDILEKSISDIVLEFVNATPPIYRLTGLEHAADKLIAKEYKR